MTSDSPLRGQRFVVAVGALALLVLLPGTALAHANLERADPAPGSQLDQPPRDLQLFFSEAVDGSFSRVQLLNAQGQPVDRGDSHVAPNDLRSLLVSLPDQVPNGVYTVAWRTLSAVDGHTVNGAYPLIFGPMPAEGVPVTTGASSSQATFGPETAVGRWWFFIAAAAMFGALLSWLVATVLQAVVDAVVADRAHHSAVAGAGSHPVRGHQIPAMYTHMS